LESEYRSERQSANQGRNLAEAVGRVKSVARGFAGALPLGGLTGTAFGSRESDASGVGDGPCESLMGIRAKLHFANETGIGSLSASRAAFP
jgi:hypothetical protein